VNDKYVKKQKNEEEEYKGSRMWRRWFIFFYFAFAVTYRDGFVATEEEEEVDGIMMCSNGSEHVDTEVYKKTFTFTLQKGDVNWFDN
jgi:hypothetical protein